MYIIKIENIEKQNGQPYASVSFTRDTGTTEEYRELFTVSEATEETAAVYDYALKTRPVIEVVYDRFAFNNQEQLDARIAGKLKELTDKHVAASAVVIGDYTPIETVEEVTTEPVKTAEEIEVEAFQAAKSEWLQKKNALTAMIDDMERGQKLGIQPDELQVGIMQELATWVNTNMDRRYYF